MLSAAKNLSSDTRGFFAALRMTVWQNDSVSINQMKGDNALSASILHFQQHADQAGQGDDGQAERRPREQDALRGVGLAVDRVERSVIDGVAAEKLAIVDFVVVQTDG